MDKITQLLNPIPDVAMEREMLIKQVLESPTGFHFTPIKGEDLLVRSTVDEKQGQAKFYHIKFKDIETRDNYLKSGILSFDYFTNKKQHPNENRIEWDHAIKVMDQETSMMCTNFAVFSDEKDIYSMTIDGKEVPYNYNFNDLFFDVILEDFKVSEEDYEKYYKVLLTPGDHQVVVKKTGSFSPDRDQFYKDEYFCNQAGFLKSLDNVFKVVIVKGNKDETKKNVQDFYDYIEDKFSPNYEEDIMVQKLNLDISYLGHLVELNVANGQSEQNTMFLNLKKEKESILKIRKQDISKMKKEIEAIKTIWEKVNS